MRSKRLQAVELERRRAICWLPEIVTFSSRAQAERPDRNVGGIWKSEKELSSKVATRVMRPVYQKVIGKVSNSLISA
jgi:hypothetical protein